MDTPTDKSTTLLVGRDARELYLREIKRNLETLMREVGELEAAISELKQEQLRNRETAE